uniref:Nuclear speckle splicing regulatory protein 1 N-terminal domain-containing protein n=1 Tax=Ditylenchus dipsaci TaxID=166011 RepID=A0A915DLD4_9BILA
MNMILYEKLECRKNVKVVEQREADKNREPKYIKNMLSANKKRELEQLVRDENTYKKEREAEAGQFDDKKCSITSLSQTARGA